MRYGTMLQNNDQLPLWECLETAGRRVGGCCEMAASLGVSWRDDLVVRQSPASKDMNKEATALVAVARRQPVKIHQTEKT
jgi:hypothetical protein